MLLLTPACVLPSHLLRRLLFSSHTSLLVLNWWERSRTSVDNSLHVKKTYLFLRFLQQLHHTTLVRRATSVRLASPVASFALRMGSSRPKRRNFIHTTSVMRMNFVADMSWGWTEWFCMPTAISADVSAEISYGGTHKQAQWIFHWITGRCIWTEVFGCLREKSSYRLWENMERMASKELRSRSNDDLPRVFFFLFLDFLF